MSSQIQFVKLLVLLNSAVPAALLAWDAVRGQLGANPINFAIRTTGMLSLIFLMLTLLVTPLVRLAGWNWFTPNRRVLGLYAFFYALAHFLIFFSLDRELSLSGTFSEMALRPYLAVGSLGLLVMVPLAVTSTNRMIQRLGTARWKQLHRLTYVAALAGVVHYGMLVKADLRWPLAFMAVLTLLLGWRLYVAGTKPAPKPPTRRPGSRPNPLPESAG
jgi:sulfoxide reductase heme-binding subunit YedZ